MGRKGVVLGEIEISISDNQDALEIDREKLIRTAEYVLEQICGNESAGGNESLVRGKPAAVSLAIVDDEAISKIKE
ncbi:MAG: hypothetical protein KAT56_05690, partial [Sedimentisphaerales bacterium]|nr:hypothetical protein [Sedimentisphaerales bacterium]